MTRVLIGEFGAIFRVGLADLLADVGCDILLDDQGPADLFEQAAGSEPDVVVLDLDRPGAEAMARSLSALLPAVTVIACSSASAQMRVYPPFHAGESYLSDLSPDLLVRASTGT
ncbi:MAG: hypothetical protein ACRD0C_09890 [Acidimicrobiia bacterium]